MRRSRVTRRTCRVVVTLASPARQDADAARSVQEPTDTRVRPRHERIDAVENVAEALFDEWQSELAQCERVDLRAASARRLEETRRRHKPMIAAMKRAHQRVWPVLGAMRDNVLALEQQINARALDREVDSVEREVNALVVEMNRSIEEDSRFLSGLDQA